jgi:hypothetical protein
MYVHRVISSHALLIVFYLERCFLIELDPEVGIAATNCKRFIIQSPGVPVVHCLECCFNRVNGNFSSIFVSYCFHFQTKSRELPKAMMAQYSDQLSYNEMLMNT